MIFNMVGGGGAGGASIFIINSANERPTNVFNNTLWVNTDVDVVKYVFSDNEPSSPTEGMLWLTISDSDNINVAAPINKDWMKFNLGIVRQYIGGAWERKLAQLYKDGIWVDVSRLFVAYIDITYPANSNCTVTNSIGQVVASNTNSTSSPKTFTAIVDATGTYTVTATDPTDPSKTKSLSYEISSEGQWEHAVLEYALVIIKNGYAKVQFDLANDPTEDGGDGYYRCGEVRYSVDVTNYSALKIDGKYIVGGSGSGNPALLVKNASGVVKATQTFSTARQTYTIDLSGLTGIVQIYWKSSAYQHDTKGWQSTTPVFYNMWLEQ